MQSSVDAIAWFSSSGQIVCGSVRALVHDIAPAFAPCGKRTRTSLPRVAPELLAGRLLSCVYHPSCPRTTGSDKCGGASPCRDRFAVPRFAPSRLGGAGVASRRPASGLCGSVRRHESSLSGSHQCAQPPIARTLPRIRCGPVPFHTSHTNWLVWRRANWLRVFALLRFRPVGRFGGTAFSSRAPLDKNKRLGYKAKLTLKEGALHGEECVRNALAFVV